MISSRNDNNVTHEDKARGKSSLLKQLFQGEATTKLLLMLGLILTGLAASTLMSQRSSRRLDVWHLHHFYQQRLEAWDEDGDLTGNREHPITTWDYWGQDSADAFGNPAFESSKAFVDREEFLYMVGRFLMQQSISPGEPTEEKRLKAWEDAHRIINRIFGDDEGRTFVDVVSNEEGQDVEVEVHGMFGDVADKMRLLKELLSSLNGYGDGSPLPRYMNWPDINAFLRLPLKDAFETLTPCFLNSPYNNYAINLTELKNEVSAMIPEGTTDSEGVLINVAEKIDELVAQHSESEPIPRKRFLTDFWKWLTSIDCLTPSDFENFRTGPNGENKFKISTARYRELFPQPEPVVEETGIVEETLADQTSTLSPEEDTANPGLDDAGNGLEGTGNPELDEVTAAVEEQPNIGLIIGIAAGCFVLLLGFIWFCCFRKKGTDIERR